MNGLPPDTDLSFLLGALLIQACFGENEVILNFDVDVSIMSATTMHVWAEDGSVAAFTNHRDDASRLLRLLGQTVTRAEAVGDGSMSISWSNGTLLQLFDIFEYFESYTISHGAETIVV